MTLDQFKAEADRLIQDRYYLDINEVDDRQIRGAWLNNETPSEFVEWWAEKYDLYTFEAWGR
jgi:hypothetical protein